MARFISLPSSIDKKTFKNCIYLFCVLTLLIYGKSIGNGYSMDDEYVIHNNKQVHGGIAKIPEIFRSTYAIDEKASFEYRPLVKVTYAIEYQFFGESPHLSHFINLLIYILCLVLLFYALLRLLPGYHYLFALTVTLLFLIHPLHSEVVISLKNRDVMMSFIGCMCSLLFYLRYVEGKGKAAVNLALGFFVLLLGIMSKKDAMTFFAIIPFSMWFFRDAGWKKIGMIVLTYLPVIIAFRLAARSVTNTTVRTLLQWENPLFIHSTFAERIPQGFYSLYFYLKMFLLPHPLISYYGYNQVPIVGWSHPVVWIMLLLLIGLVYLIIKLKAIKTLWAYGIIYFLVTISMFTNVVVPVVGIVGERFAYIPSVGLCIVAAYFLLNYFKVPLQNLALKLKLVSNGYWLAIALALLLYGGKSFSRNADWKDAYTLYRADVETASESAHTHSLLAATALARVKAEPRLPKAEKKRLVMEAEEHYLESIRIIPDYTSSHNNLGMLYYTYLADNAKATKHLEKAVALDSNYVEAYFNLGSCYAAAQKYDLAEKCYLRSVKLNPKFTTAYQALSSLYGMQKKYDQILRLNQEAIDKGVKSDVMYVNIGNVYFMTGDTVKALPYLEKAIEFNSNNRGVNGFLANWYQAKGDKQKAAYYYDLMSRSSSR